MKTLMIVGIVITVIVINAVLLGTLLTMNMMDRSHALKRGLFRLLVVGGRSSSEYLKSVEVVNLDGSLNPCMDLPDLPIFLEGSVGFLLHNKTAFICGGFSHNQTMVGSGPVNKCFFIKNGEWTPAPSLNFERFYAASNRIEFSSNDEKIIVAGGANSTNILKTVEIFDGESWKTDPKLNLPFPVWQHCLVRINRDTVLLIGGSSSLSTEGASNKTFFFNNRKWIRGPDLIDARSNRQTCGVMTREDPSTGIQVIVAGGHGRNGTLKSTERLLIGPDYSLDNLEWTQGPDLPAGAEYGSMVEFENTLVLVGGEKGVDGYELYQLTPGREEWNRMSETLKKDRSFHVTVLVPNDLTMCKNETVIL